MIVRVTSWDHKSKMRIIEHGDLWKTVSVPRDNGDQVLLESCKTGYLKWWKLTHINSP